MWGTHSNFQTLLTAPRYAHPCILGARHNMTHFLEAEMLVGISQRSLPLDTARVCGPESPRTQRKTKECRRVVPTAGRRRADQVL